MKCKQCNLETKDRKGKQFCSRICKQNYRYYNDVDFRNKKIERTLNRFYVYAYYDKQGNIIYIGKGSGNRITDIINRSKSFKDYINNNEYSYGIIEENLKESMAFTKESILLIKYKPILNDFIPTSYTHKVTFKPISQLTPEDIEHLKKIKPSLFR